MNKRQKEVLQHQFGSEKAVLEQLEKQYQTALNDINRKIRILQSDEMTQSKIYRLEYQKALKKQVEAILEKLHSDEFTTIQEYGYRLLWLTLRSYKLILINWSTNILRPSNKLIAWMTYNLWNLVKWDLFSLADIKL